MNPTIMNRLAGVNSLLAALLLATPLVTSMVACGPTPNKNDGGIVDIVGNDGGSTGDTDAGSQGVDAGSQPGMNRCQATPVICSDQSSQELDLFSAPTDAQISVESSPDTAFRSLIDATGGGLSPTKSYVYGRFETTGLSKVAIGDEAAFDSLDWDIAFRRYIIRLNSGVSGPSCVLAARVPPGITFDQLTQAPDNLVWRTEEYFTEDTCDFVADTSGIGAPATALGSFWSYQSCVQMTHNVFVVHLRDGRYIKLQVLSYYKPSAQDTCDATGKVPSSQNEAGKIRIKWAFISAPANP